MLSAKAYECFNFGEAINIQNEKKQIKKDRD